MSTFIDLLQRFGTMGLPALLLMVVGLVSAPLLVRRVLRGEAVSLARWRSPGVELILLCWVSFAYEGAEKINSLIGAQISDLATWQATTVHVLGGRAMMSVAALSVTVWMALCAAMGAAQSARLKGSPERRAKLVHGLKVSTLLSFVLVCQAGVFVSLAALVEVIREDGMPVCLHGRCAALDALMLLIRDFSVPEGAASVIPLVRRLESFLGALLVVFLGVMIAAWTTPLRAARRDLWQIIAAAAVILVWSGSVGHALWSGLRWNVWRGVLDLPYVVPQRPPDVPFDIEDALQEVCAQDGERWRCLSKEGVRSTERLVTAAHTLVALPQDTPLAELWAGRDDGPNLVLCAGSPRASTRGLERWFQPRIADCSDWLLRRAAPEDEFKKDHVVIEASRDWTVQDLVDEVVRLRRDGHYWMSVRWAEEAE